MLRRCEEIGWIVNNNSEGKHVERTLELIVRILWDLGFRNIRSTLNPKDNYIFLYERGDRPLLGIALIEIEFGMLLDCGIDVISRELGECPKKLVLFTCGRRISPENRRRIKAKCMQYDFVSKELDHLDFITPTDVTDLYELYFHKYNEYRKKDPILLHLAYNRVTFVSDKLRKKLFHRLFRLGVLCVKTGTTRRGHSYKRGLRSYEYLSIHGDIIIGTSQKSIHAPRKIDEIKEIKSGKAAIGLESPPGHCRYMQCMYRLECEVLKLKECPRRNADRSGLLSKLKEEHIRIQHIKTDFQRLFPLAHGQANALYSKIMENLNISNIFKFVAVNKLYFTHLTKKRKQRAFEHYKPINSENLELYS